MDEPREHHFVPRFLLDDWRVGHDLRGYWWDPRRKQLTCKLKGPKAFCFQIDLLTLRASGRGRYDIERIFFGDIDDKGAKARNQLLSSGRLTGDRRRDFARLLLSLEVRRPFVVSKLREEGTKYITGELDNDPEILASLKDNGITLTPSEYAERVRGVCFEDRAVGLVKGLVANSQVEGVLINAFWHTVSLGPRDGSFVLSDRPLIRINPFDKPGATWALPLSPKTAFVATNHPANLERIKHISAQRFAKEMNRSSAGQAEKFVFSVADSDRNWLGKHLGNSQKNMPSAGPIASFE